MVKSSSFDLSGKAALVTGGGGLLGPEHGAALARAGAAVILVDLFEAGLKAARQGILDQVPAASVKTALLDITDEAALVKFNETLLAKNIQVDILVNNAAINPKMNQTNSGYSGQVENYDMSEWDKEIRVGITGTFLCCKVFGSAMAKRGQGVIINIASDLALQAPDQRVYSPTGKIEDVKNFKPIGYPVVKAAMLGLNRYLATYWAHRGVRVNCLVPGAVYNNQPESLVENVKQRVPLGRWADRSEYQGAIVFLASEASSYMTGQMLVMDGGRSVW
jgi:NAD(P)-dependent dehydrogenase (short-subunit alcohol dehydrogenase family)